MKEKIKSHKTELFLFALFVFAVFSICMMRAAKGFSVNDGGWHVRLGEEILKQKKVNIAPLAWGADLKTTHNHEWLYDVIIYLLSRGNLYHMLIINFAVFMAGLLLLLKGLHLFNGKHTAAYVITLCLFMITAAKSNIPRPSPFSFFCFSSECLILAGAAEHKTKHVWFLPLIQLVWSNLHGGSSPLCYGLILVVMIFCLFPSAWMNRYGMERKPAVKQLLVPFFLCLAAAMITPYGIKGFTYPYFSMSSSNSAMTTFITEWFPASIKNESDFFEGFLPMAAGLIALAYALHQHKAVSPVWVILFLTTSFMFLWSIRFGIYFIPITARYIDEIIPEDDIKLFPMWALKVFLVFGIVISTISTAVIWTGHTKITDGYDQRTFWSEVAEYSGSCPFNDYNVGHVMTYYEINHWIDGRYDPFIGIFKDCVDLARNDSRSGTIEKMMKKYKFTSFIVKKDSPLDYWLKDHKWVKKASAKFQGTEYIFYIPESGSAGH